MSLLIVAACGGPASTDGPAHGQDGPPARVAAPTVVEVTTDRQVATPDHRTADSRVAVASDRQVATSEHATGAVQVEVTPKRHAALPDHGTAALQVEATAPNPTDETTEELSASAQDGSPRPSGAADLGAVTHVWQKWNNCGPASALMALSVFGVTLDQMEVAAQLKPDREDTNVTPEEMAAYARSIGLEARAGYGGDRHTARAVILAGAPLIAEQWIDVEGRGQMGHYVVVVGFDDAAGEFVVNDSYYGARRRHTYEAFERMWQPFSGAYVVPYAADQRELLQAAMGDAWNEAGTWARLLTRGEAQVQLTPDEAWAWYALGEARSRTGDHHGAVSAFDKAINIGLPFRAFWYQFGYYRSLVEVGAFQRAIDHADLTLASMDGENLEESRFWRGRALLGLGQIDAAVAEFEMALHFNPLYVPAQQQLDEIQAARGAGP